VHGIAPILATLGTALTQEQVRLLKSLVSRVVLVFDGDAAGGKAMCRAFPLFSQEGLAVRVLPLPAGHDPDSYAKAHGGDLFRSPWEAAQPWFAYLLEGLIAAHGSDIEGRVRVTAALKPYVEAIHDPVEQSLWLKFAAERLGVEEALLRQNLISPATAASSGYKPSEYLAINLEKGVLRWVLHHPSYLTLEELEDWAQDFEDRELQAILTLILDNFRQYGSLDHSLLVHQVTEERLKQRICALTLEEPQVADLPEERLAADWRRAFRIRRLKKAQRALKDNLAEASARSREELQALLVQWQNIDWQIEALKIQPTTEGEDG
jgi:DNA primase